MDEDQPANILLEHDGEEEGSLPQLPGGNEGGEAAAEEQADDDERLDEGSELCAACYSGDMPLVSKLLQDGANVDSRRRKNGATVLCIAAGAGHRSVVELLCKAGAALNAANKNGATPVFLAAEHGRADCIPPLVSAGADLNRADNGGEVRGKRAMHKAVYFRSRK